MFSWDGLPVKQPKLRSGRQSAVNAKCTRLLSTGWCSRLPCCSIALWQARTYGKEPTNINVLTRICCRGSSGPSNSISSVCCAASSRAEVGVVRSIYRLPGPTGFQQILLAVIETMLAMIMVGQDINGCFLLMFAVFLAGRWWALAIDSLFRATRVATGRGTGSATL